MGWQLWSTKQSQSVKILGNVLGYKITGLWIWLNWWHCTIVDPSIASPSFIFCSLSAMELHIVLTAALVDLLLSFLASMACCFKINSLVKSICGDIPLVWWELFFYFTSFVISSFPVHFSSLSCFIVDWFVITQFVLSLIAYSAC